MPSLPGTARRLARDGEPFAVVRITASDDLPPRFSASTGAGEVDVLREVEGPPGTWVVAPLDGDLADLAPGQAIDLVRPGHVALTAMVVSVTAPRP